MKGLIRWALDRIYSQPAPASLCIAVLSNQEIDALWAIDHNRDETLIREAVR